MPLTSPQEAVVGRHGLCEVVADLLSSRLAAGVAGLREGLLLLFFGTSKVCKIHVSNDKGPARYPVMKVLKWRNQTLGVSSVLRACLRSVYC
jgi:hypothetical protein